MLEGPAIHRSVRRSRRLRRVAIPWRPLAILFAAVAIVALIARLASWSAAPDPADAVRQGQAALARGNYSAARNHFTVAVAADPTDGTAQAALARAYVLLGEGVAAQGAVDRAASAGVPAARLHHLRAAAAFLQGDDDTAILESGRTTGLDAPYARRIRARALADRGDRPGAVATLQSLLAGNGRDAGAWGDLGRIRFDLGDIGGANEAAQRAIALDPTNLAALVLRGEVVRSQYGLVASLPWFEAALRRDAYFHPALVEYAGTLGDAGRYRDSLSAARRALVARPGSPQALYLLAVIAARAGNMPLAGDLLDRTGGALNGLPGGLLLSGGVDYARGRYEQAVVKFRALVGLQPMNLPARRLLGAAMLRAGDAAGALAALRPIALRSDADSYTLGVVARAFEAQGQRDWAARFLDRPARPASPAARPFGQDDDPGVLADAVAEAPDDPGLAVSYVRALIESGQWPAALARAQAIVRAAPGAPDAHLLLGDVFAAGARYPASAASYARAADLRFDRPTMLRLVEARSLAGDRRAAADVLALYLSQNPADVTARRVLANLQSLAGDARGAVDTLEALRADLGGRDAALLTHLAYAYTAAGDPAAAIPYARAAYRLQPLGAATTDAWGWALFERGDTPGALDLLGKAAALAPRHAGIRWHQAQAFADAGRTVEARAAIRIAQTDPAFPDRAAAARLLATLPPDA